MIDQLIEFFRDWGVWGLVVVSFTESSFFIVPPDALLIPMSIVNPSNALLYALYTTVASVLGGIFGYFLGQIIGRPLLQKFASPHIINKAEMMYEKYGAGAIIFAGFTPIPYKVFTVLSGAVKMNLPVFIIGSLIGRGARFFLVALVVMYFGDQAMSLITKYGAVTTLIVGVIFIFAFFIYRKRKVK
ncbi:YqaA family protein [Bacillus sp. CGMCC 1.16541]|uniref:YqaA family protein n=1 Tax=Bacillus sp. CGMCC 1.16541 TaxID=2185143 RepID=UPI000D73A2AF|nr:YqaA family protein [Bacillus sp. CGMCC 1.16541]